MENIRYREARECDLEGFMDCLISVYGTDSYYTRFYDLDYVRGRLGRIFIAERHGEVIGTLVLSDWGYEGRDHELSTFTVRRGLSGDHVGGALLRYTLEKIGSRIPSVKGANVTHHTASQILTERNAFHPTGLLFGVFRDKSALLLILRNHSVRAVGRLFVPEALLSAAERVYRMFGVSFLPERRSADVAAPETCDIWYEHDAHFQYADVYILSYGSDCAARVAEIEAVCAQPDLTMNLFIDMRSPNAPLAYEALLDEGCVYAGFMPLSEAHEYIILHRPCGKPIRYDAMRLTEDSARTLRALGVDLGEAQ
ncbi:MAG: GNAT family N-acetyltransferase [Clostridiales Family XIII bacterium]|nr:GNAT family N-acetyltransferase [Clostridiales Family XIII bacterium]